MVKRVTIFGGSGFVGSAIADLAVERGYHVRLAQRRAPAASGSDDNTIEHVACNILNEHEVAAALEGASAVVNSVGILAPERENSFRAVQAAGAERIARLSASAGIARMVHISAIGAGLDADAEYSQTKAQGEAAIQGHLPDAVILRPSVIFGARDQFFNRFAGMTRFSPFLPLVGAGVRFQPVFVGDVAQAAIAALSGKPKAGIYELGGPDVATFRELMELMLEVLGRKRIILPLPGFAAYSMALGSDVARALSGDRLPAVVTRDQVKNLARDNVVTQGAMGFSDLEISPTPIRDELAKYLT